MKKICKKCMGNPCVCLPEEKTTYGVGGGSRIEPLYTPLEYRKIIRETEKATEYHLKKTTLDNGFVIPPGTKAWFPKWAVASSAPGTDREDRILKKMKIQNRYLNEVIRSINLRNLKGIE